MGRLHTCSYVRSIGLPAVDGEYSGVEFIGGTGVRTSPGHVNVVGVVDFDTWAVDS